MKDNIDVAGLPTTAACPAYAYRPERSATVVERTNRVIKQIFETEKYDLILQEAVFWSPKVDITDKVIKALNAQGGK